MTLPSETADPQNQNSLPLPTGTPLTDWGGIPILPGASAGEGDESGYAFIVKTDVVDIQQYYEETLRGLGWMILANSLDDTGSVLMIAMKDDAMLTLTVTPLAGGVMYVFLVK